MSDHAPAPWDAEWNGHCWIVGNARDAVATTQFCYAENTEANARLIAAAPDLLEVLQQMVDEKADYMRINNLGDPEKQHTIKQARAAIAKAAPQP